MKLFSESILAAAMLAGSFAMTYNDAELLNELINRVDTVAENVCPLKATPA